MEADPCPDLDLDDLVGRSPDEAVALAENCWCHPDQAHRDRA
jgi:hypothetical protein